MPSTLFRVYFSSSFFRLSKLTTLTSSFVSLLTVRIFSLGTLPFLQNDLIWFYDRTHIRSYFFIIACQTDNLKLYFESFTQFSSEVQFAQIKFSTVMSILEQILVVHSITDYVLRPMTSRLF